MTCPPYSRWPNTSIKLVLLLLCFNAHSCSSISDFFFSTTKEESLAEKERRRRQSIASQFEWAVQNYEAGDYEKALEQFRRLAAIGTDLPAYELVPFYAGMSFFRLKKYAEAASALENFLQKRTGHSQNQDARMALLEIYEQQAQWDKVLGLAAETEPLTLYQNNRAYLKLVWARALKEKGEFKGAKAVLQDATAYMENQNADDLWGRYHYTSLMLEKESCSNSTPKTIGKKVLYEPWLDATVDCYRRLIGNLTQELLGKESAWSDLATQQLDQALASLGSQLRVFLQKEKPRLQNYRKLNDLSRQNLYRLMGKVDESLKNFKNQGITSPHLELIRKRIDLLLVSLVSPS